MKTLEVKIQLSFCVVTTEVVVPDDASENEIYNLAIAEIEKELGYSKLDSYR